MNPKSAHLPAVIAVFLFSFSLIFAQPSPQEIRKIEAAIPSTPFVKVEKPHKILIFSLSKGYRHASVPYAAKTFELMGKKTATFEVEQSADMNIFTPERLAKFDAIILNNTTRLKFENPVNREALLEFVRNGGGLIGVHAASDNFYTWQEGAEILGGQFDQHPWTADGTWRIKIEDKNNPLTAMFNGRDFDISDEIYRIRPIRLRENCRVLLALDMNDARNRSAKGVRITDLDIPVSWIRVFGKGRVFYCSLGHNPHIFWNPKILAHYLAGIQFALGDLKADAAPVPFDLEKAISTQEIRTLLNSVRNYEYGQSRVHLADFSNLVRLIRQNPKLTKKLEKEVLRVLSSKQATLAAKQFLCEELSTFGGEQSLPVLEKMLYDTSAAAMSVYALERIPGTKTDKLLREAVKRIDPKTRISVITALGHRKDIDSENLLRKLLKDKDLQISGAALNALSYFNSDKTVEAIKKIARNKAHPLNAESYGALLRIADNLINENRLSKQRKFFILFNQANRSRNISLPLCAEY
ncbi:MAG: hypothetical protein GXO77_04635 [Calditrichaeota bacterium]|nr:hypothetical protein [Calditrichota bacterium]